MILHFIIFLTFYLNLSNATTVYDSYYGVPITEERMEELIAAGSVDTCINNVEPCNETEGRRIDATCNNFEYPSFGATHTPQIRFLEAAFDANYEPRKSKSGKPLMLPRKLRQAILKVGNAMSLTFNQLMSYFTEFGATDTLSGHDITNYLFVTTHCCEESGKTDYMCTPNIIPEDDPVHRFSGYRCMNQTRPFSFQNQKCIPNDTTPVRMDYSTVLLDLGPLYNFIIGEIVITKIRAYKGGLLKTEIIKGKEFSSDGNSSCMIKDVFKTGCTRTVPNGFIGTNLFSNLLWRLHNSIARKLAELNPTWDDNKLFDVSRDINIAMYQHITYYELWASLLGRENMIEYGIITRKKTLHRDLYNETIPPQLYTEYPIVTRWFHTIQGDTQRKITPNGTHVGDIQIVDNSLRVHDLTLDNNMTNLLHGACAQAGGGHDYTTDHDIADRGLGYLQNTIDLSTQDINKGRYFGTAPYIEYRDKCMNYSKTHKTFEDLEYIISEENLEIMKSVYEYPEDIELMTGIILEKHIKGGHVPATAACIIMEQLKQSIITDRHWYERPNRPNAFTKNQLYEIKKSSMAGILCEVEDSFTHIQPKAFLRVGPNNQVVSCEDIPKVDLSAWKETNYE